MMTSSLNLTSSPDSAAQCYRFEVIWLGLVVIPVCVLGYIGNTLCLLVLYRVRRHSSVTILLLKALAASDLLYLALFSLMKLWPRLLPGLSILPYMHAYVWPLVSMLLSIATWLMVLLTGQRYIVVCHPLDTRRWSTVARVRLQIGVVCIVAVVMDIPRFFELQVARNNRSEALQIKPTWIYTEYYYNLLYKNGLMLLYRKLLPLALTIVLTARLVNALYTARHHRFQLGQQQQRRRKAQRVAPHEQRITKVLLTVVLVFILCQMPGSVYPVLRMTRVDKECGTVYYYLYIVADGLTVVNSAVNFLIYMLCSSEFRQGFYKLWRRQPTGATDRHSRRIQHPTTGQYTHRAHIRTNV